MCYGKFTGSDYVQAPDFGMKPTVLSSANYARKPSSVTPIELTEYMTSIIGQDGTVSPQSSSLEKKTSHPQTETKKTKKTKSQGPEGAEKRRKPKSKPPQPENKDKTSISA